MNQKQSLELERKYLVKRLPGPLSRYPHETIHQGYLVRTPDSLEIRIRQRGKQFTITVKKGTESTRLEQEIKLRKKEYEMLWPLTGGQRLKKVRYKIPFKKYTIELDIYQGKLHGLKTAEVEFRSSREMREFSPPQWFGKEITGSRKYSNWNLARKGLTSSSQRRKRG